MPRSVAEANDALFAIRRLPFGVARSTACAAEVERIRSEGPEGALAFGLFSLTECYVWGEEVSKAYLPFTELLRWWDTHPEHFDQDDTHSMFWSFKWMVGQLMDFPTVPAEQIERTLDDMARRYALAGNGMNAVALERFQWARTRGDAQTESRYQEWVTTPRDDFSQCEACEPGDRASYLFEVGRVAEGIRMLEEVLDGRPGWTPSCATEPGDMLSHLQLAYLEVGDAEAAGRAHRRGMQNLGVRSPMAGPKARHIEFCARSGNPRLALTLIEEHARFLLAADTPYERWVVLTAVGAATGLLRATHGDTALRLGDVPARTVADLDDWVRRAALELAAAFDARNGTDRMTAATHAAWERAAQNTLQVSLSVLSEVDGGDVPIAAQPAAAGTTAGIANGAAGGGPTRTQPARPGDPNYVDVSALVAGPGGEPSTPTAGPPAPRPMSERTPSSPDEMLTRAEALATADPAAAARLYQSAARLLEAAGYLERAGFALAEAAELAARQGDPEVSAAFDRALRLLRAAGTPPRFVGPVARARARHALGPDDLAAALPILDRVLAELTAADGAGAATAPTADLLRSEELAARQEADRRSEIRHLKDTRARVLAGLGRHDDAAKAAETVAEDFARAGEIADAAHAFWLAGSARLAGGPRSDAVDLLESAVEGFGIAHRRDERTRAGNELIALLREFGRDEDAAALAESLAR